MQTDTPGVRRRNMARHLPYGDMPLLGRLGVSFSKAEDGHSEGEWRPAHEACNPRGIVQGGLFSMAFDATMSMAILSALPPEDTCVSLEIKTSTPGGARPGQPLQPERTGSPTGRNGDLRRGDRHRGRRTDGHVQRDVLAAPQAAQAANRGRRVGARRSPNWDLARGPGSRH